MFNKWLEEDPDHIKEKIFTKVYIMFWNERWKIHEIYGKDKDKKVENIVK